jgi:FKBP-type peptidyl-prolyl cis-trans isomerase
MKLELLIIQVGLVVLPCTGFQVVTSTRLSNRNLERFSTQDATADDPFESYKAGSEIAWKDTTVGQGDVVEEGDVLTVAYTGYLWRNKQEFDKGDALTFKLGGGKVMPGFDEGVRGIKEGGKRIIRLPPKLAYGNKGAGNGKIPPNSDLEFEVEVTSVARGPIAGTLAMVGKTRVSGFAVLTAILAITPMIG